MLVRDIMVRPVITVRADATLEEVASIMLRHRIGCTPVVDEREALRGIVTETDFTGKETWVPFSMTRVPKVFGEWLPRGDVEHLYHDARALKAGDVMTSPVITATEDEPIGDIIERMIVNRIKRVPVVRGSTPVGIVSRHDLLHLVCDA